jgi:Flp pilus assembly secretin CpaC
LIGSFANATLVQNIPTANIKKGDRKSRNFLIRTLATKIVTKKIHKIKTSGVIGSNTIVKSNTHKMIVMAFILGFKL